MIKSQILVKTTTFDLSHFFCETRDGQSNSEKIEIINLHLRRTGFWWMILLETATNSIIAMSRDLPEAQKKFALKWSLHKNLTLC